MNSVLYLYASSSKKMSEMNKMRDGLIIDHYFPNLTCFLPIPSVVYTQYLPVTALTPLAMNKGGKEDWKKKTAYYYNGIYSLRQTA